MPGARTEIDLLVHGASELATPLGREPRGGAALGAIEVHAQAAVAIEGGLIRAIGPQAELEARYAPRARLDARAGLIVPGFVDAHTHPVFAATREEEFELRTRGASYVEIAQAGGGILSSVRSLRAASKEQLLAGLLLRLDRFLELGTTTIEAKSGYGLSLEDELKSLEVIEAARRLHPVELVPTFLGAHEVPPEYRERRDEYVELVCERMLPEVAQRKLAEYCDVFVEAHVFDLAHSRRILERARELGFGLRLHADQLSALGGAQLAAELGAASADHLEFATPQGIEALAAAGVVPVLCPLVPLVLRIEQEAPARRMVSAGLAPALSTDFNPGSCAAQSMHEALTFAALRYRFSAAECLSAATLNAACSLGRGARLGSLEVGKQADLVVLELSSHKQLCYDFGRARVQSVLKAGAHVYQRQPGRIGASANHPIRTP